MRYLTDEESKNKVYVYHKGSPPTIKGICKNVYTDQNGNSKPFDEEEQEHFEAIKQGMYDENLKLICIAMRTLTYEEYISIHTAQLYRHTDSKHSKAFATLVGISN